MGKETLNENYRGVFDASLGFGQKPVLLIVDFVNAYTTPGSPLYAPPVIDAVQETIEVLELARSKGVLVVYTRVVYSANHQLDGGMFVQKIPALRVMVEGEPLANIVQDLSPLPQDIVINKQYASAFFASPLNSILTSQGVDTIILTGCSTSGCVRATAVDGIQYGFRVIVPRECVADRRIEPHEANLFDINSKYGDVISKVEVLSGLQKLKCSGLAL